MKVENEEDIRANTPLGVRIRFTDTRGWESGPHIHKTVFPVIKKTPKGVWIMLPYGSKETVHGRNKFVLDDTRVAFAYPTEEQAWESFIIRKQHQIGHLEVSLKDTKHLLNLAKERKVSYTYDEWLELGEDIVEFS